VFTDRHPGGFGRPGLTLVTVAALAIAGAALTATPSAQARRSVYVTVTGDKGEPADGLSPADFTLKVDGKTCTVLESTPATEPVSVALLLDDRGSDINEIRTALAAFVARVQGRAAVSLISVVPTVQTVFDYTPDNAVMMAGIRRLVWRAGPASGLILSAIADTADSLGRREVARPNIVVVTFEGGEFRSHKRAQDVLASLERSRTVMHVVAVGKPTLRRMNRAVVDSGNAQGDEWTVDENNRNAVLGEGPSQSGGRRHELTVATGLSSALEAVASDLINQQQLVYECPRDSPGSRKLSVSTKRRGVSVRAPAKVGG
jgi:VWFA-related protein